MEILVWAKTTVCSSPYFVSLVKIGGYYLKSDHGVMSFHISSFPLKRIEKTVAEIKTFNVKPKGSNTRKQHTGKEPFALKVIIFKPISGFGGACDYLGTKSDASPCLNVLCHIG